MATISSEPYEPRAIRFLAVWRTAGFRLKAYTITYCRDAQLASLIEAARGIAADRLRASAEATRHHGVGFVGIHAGKTADFVFVDWWADQNELHHHVYVRQARQDGGLDYATPSGVAACVWDLLLIAHERDAWVRHAMTGADAEAGIEAYLNDVLRSDA